MELSDQQLIAEAIETNHAGVRKDRTLDRYRDHLVHFSHYLASVFGVSFYAPSRRQTFSDARWRDIDFEQATWRVMGKGDKFDIFDLAPPLIRALRLYRHWQLSEAARNEAMRDALADPETAYVLMTRSGRKTPPQTIDKIAKWHAVKAGVGVRKSQSECDGAYGLTSRVSPHSYRRAWANIALNEKELPPIDVVSRSEAGRDWRVLESRLWECGCGRGRRAAWSVLLRRVEMGDRGATRAFDRPPPGPDMGERLRRLGEPVGTR